MSPADWAVLAVSFVVIIGYGLWRSRGRQSLESYVVAGKQMRWWVIGLSIMATQASAVTFIGTTSQGYADGLRFVQFYFGLPIAMVLIAAVAAPVFHRSGVYTAYEYLERRFDAKTRTLAGLVFLVQRGLGVGLALYAPAVVLSVILELPEWATIAATGVMVSAYTMIGGIKAVMWTDALQMTVMLAGVVAAFFAAAAGLPEDVSLGSALRLAGAAGKLNAVESSLDWNSRYTLWSGLIGGAFLALAYFGADQSQVQRYLTAKSVEHSRVSLLFNAVLKVPLQFFILLTGVVIFAFFIFERPPMLFHAGEKARVEQARGDRLALVESRYAEAFDARRSAARRLLQVPTASARQGYLDAERRFQGVRGEAASLAEEGREPGSYNDTNYIFLTFVLQHLPAGLIGLIMAGVFAAAMSTISSELNSLATATVVDHYGRYIRPNLDDAAARRALKLATVGWGVYATVFAGYGGRLGSLIEAVNFVGSLFYGPHAGGLRARVRLPQMYGRRAFWGTALGLIAVWSAKIVFPDLAFLWLNPLGCLATVAAAMTLSAARPSAARS